MDLAVMILTLNRRGFSVHFDHSDRELMTITIEGHKKKHVRQISFAFFDGTRFTISEIIGQQINIAYETLLLN